MYNGLLYTTIQAWQATELVNYDNGLLAFDWESVTIQTQVF